MSEQLWAHRAPPAAGGTLSAVWQGQPGTAAELSAQRVMLRSAVIDGVRPGGSGEEDVERLLLVFEELGSNGLRHGRPPVEVTVTATNTGWLLDVSDAATSRPPVLAVGRDPADGGLGLYLVARLCAAHGWNVREGRKHVWGCVDLAGAAQIPGPAGLPRPRGHSTNQHRR